MTVRTYWAWEITAMLRLLGGARGSRRPGEERGGVYGVATRTACYWVLTLAIVTVNAGTSSPLPPRTMTSPDSSRRQRPAGPRSRSTSTPPLRTAPENALGRQIPPHYDVCELNSTETYIGVRLSRCEYSRLSHAVLRKFRRNPSVC